MPYAHRDRLWILTGLGSALIIAVFLSPFASPNPDGLDRVSKDLNFERNATENPLSHRLPFRHLFEEYSVKGVPAAIATPLAGLIGTLATFGLAWGIGKLATAANPPINPINVSADPGDASSSPTDSEHP